MDWSKIKELENELSTKWPALSTATHQDFLSREWSQYGTCSGLTQFDYFETTLKLYDAIDLDNKLNSINVVPGPRYNPYTVLDNFNARFGFRIAVYCGNKPSVGPLVEIITRFEFRINRDGETVESVEGYGNYCRTPAVEFPF